MLTRSQIIRRARPAAPCPGIYFLIKGREILYIGKSKDVRQRFFAHSMKHMGFDSWTWIPCAEADLMETERRYIEALMPARNKQITRKKQMIAIRANWPRESLEWARRVTLGE